jgi:hypothetical protein
MYIQINYRTLRVPTIILGGISGTYPEESMKALKLAEGFAIKLVAAEPIVDRTTLAM